MLPYPNQNQEIRPAAPDDLLRGLLALPFARSCPLGTGDTAGGVAREGEYALIGSGRGKLTVTAHSQYALLSAGQAILLHAAGSYTLQGVSDSVAMTAVVQGELAGRLMGDRLREGADLFDVYRSGIRRAVSLACEPLGFDAGTGSSGLIVVIRPEDSRDLEGEKFTLSVTQLMLGQTVTETVLTVDWGNLPRDHAAMRRKVNQLGWTDGYKPAAFEDGTALLLQPGSLDLPAAPGVTLTAAGFLENRLRLQLRL